MLVNKMLNASKVCTLMSFSIPASILSKALNVQRQPCSESSFFLHIVFTTFPTNLKHQQCVSLPGMTESIVIAWEVVARITISGDTESVNESCVA